MSRILIAEDETRIASFVAKGLRSAGYSPTVVGTAQEAVDLAGTGEFALLVLDLGLPDQDGFTALQRIRAMSITMPVIILTARGEEYDKLAGLEGGADDYVVKPFSPRELVARVRARLRRQDSNGSEHLQIGDLVIDVPGHRVLRGDEAISLTPLEFDLLVALARKPWQVFSREVLLEQVWGYRHQADTRLVNVHVQRLRAKVEKDPERPQVVVTVRGVGYRAGAPSHS